MTVSTHRVVDISGDTTYEVLYAPFVPVHDAMGMFVNIKQRYHFLHKLKVPSSSPLSVSAMPPFTEWWVVS